MFWKSRSVLTREEANLLRDVLLSHKWKILKEGDTAFACFSSTGLEVTVSLHNIAAILKQTSRDKREESLRAWLAGVDSDLAAMKYEEEWKAGLRPNLKPMSEIAGMIASIPEESKATTAFLYCEIVKDIAMILAMDYENRIRFITNKDLAQWKISAEEATQQALSNLWRIAAEAKIADFGTGIYRIQAGDSYDAVRILVPSIREQVSNMLSGEPLWAIPSREHLLACRADDAPAMQVLRIRTREIWEAGPYELSPGLFRADSGGQLVEMGT